MIKFQPFNRFVFPILALVLLVLPLGLHAQGDPVDFYREALTINNTGMGVLGGWAVANITLGAYGWSRQDGQPAYFNQMNLFWNTVNLSIAGLALAGNLRLDYLTLPPPELMEMQAKSQRLYLINGALDVGYMGAGFFLRYLANRNPRHEDRLRGYGNSVILQGAFLFVFDLVMYGLHLSHRNNFMEQVTLAPAREAWGLSLIVQL